MPCFAVSIRCQRAPLVVASLILVVFGFASTSESQVRTERDGIRRARRPISGRYLVVLRDRKSGERGSGAASDRGVGECVTCIATPFEALQSKRRRPARVPWPAILV